jgi:hypothetical protein
MHFIQEMSLLDCKNFMKQRFRLAGRISSIIGRQSIAADCNRAKLHVEERHFSFLIWPLLFEVFAVQWALRGHLTLLESHFRSTLKAEADLASWTVPVAAMNDCTAGVAGPVQASVRQGRVSPFLW